MTGRAKGMELLKLNASSFVADIAAAHLVIINWVVTDAFDETGCLHANVHTWSIEAQDAFLVQMFHPDENLRTRLQRCSDGEYD